MPIPDVNRQKGPGQEKGKGQPNNQNCGDNGEILINLKKIIPQKRLMDQDWSKENAEGREKLWPAISRRHNMTNLDILRKVKRDPELMDFGKASAESDVLKKKI